MTAQHPHTIRKAFPSLVVLTSISLTTALVFSSGVIGFTTIVGEW